MATHATTTEMLTIVCSKLNIVFDEAGAVNNLLVTFADARRTGCR